MSINTITWLSFGVCAGIAVSAGPALAKSNPHMEYAADFGHSAANSTPDGVPDMVYRNFSTGEVVVIYMHDGMDRPLTPADLNAQGEVFYGEGTIGAVDILNTSTEYDVSADNTAVTVDNWGTGGDGFEVAIEVSGPVVEVEVLDAERDEVLDGFDRKACSDVCEDAIRVPVAWKARSLADVGASRIRLRFFLYGAARLYSYGFESL